MADRNAPNARSHKGLHRQLGEWATEKLTTRRLQHSWLSRHVPDLQPQSSQAVVISLTSHASRFPTLDKTLKSLLLQSLVAKHVILWIAHQDVCLIPANVLALKQDGLEIREVDDYGVHNKYHCAFREFADHSIILCDDDTYYWPSWAEELCAASNANPAAICCQRAHQITLGPGGLPQPYHQWLYEVEGPTQGRCIFATGVGGVLYPPNCLHPELLDIETALRLCPTSDDIWLYWMARKAGKEFRQIGPRRHFVQWAGSQGQALWRINNGKDGGNDRQIAAMIKAFGCDVFGDGAGIQALDRVVSRAP